jgi:hypothetical protein
MANPPYATKSLKFASASTKYVNAGSCANLNFAANQPFSGTLWYRSPTAAYAALVGNLGPDTAILGWSWYSDASGYQYLRLSHDSAAFNFLEARSTINNMNTSTKEYWAHYAFTYDGSGSANGINFYMNGVGPLIKTVLRDTLTLSCVSVTSTEIGAWFTRGGSGYCNGYMCNLAVWNKALSATEVRETYNVGRPGDLSTTSMWANNAAWWKLGDGDDATVASGIVDHGPNGYNASGVNFVAGDIQTSVPGLPVYGADIVTLQQALGRYWQMEANDSVTGARYSWLATYPDYMGLGYPGPNSPASIRVSVLGPS